MRECEAALARLEAVAADRVREYAKNKGGHPLYVHDLLLHALLTEITRDHARVFPEVLRIALEAAGDDAEAADRLLARQSKRVTRARRTNRTKT